MIKGRSLLTRLNQSFRLAPGNFTSRLLLGLMAISIPFLAGCPSKTTVAATPAAPPLPAPTATIQATPATAQPGQAVVITWKTENASDITIDPLGAVQASGSATVTPGESTTYHLTAKGPGGVQQSDARITVTASAEAEPANDPEKWLTETESTRLDIFFDTDDFSIRSDQFVTIQNDAAFLKRHPGVRIVVEGHCDEMGSTEYNLALGDRRAIEVRSALEKAGVNPVRMRAVSYGKEQPFCAEESDGCSKLNRRAHIAPDVER